MPAPANRRHVFAPPEHWEQFQLAADAAELSLSEWVGQACLKNLPASVRKGLPARKGPGQPRKPAKESR